ncbi:hypothetical protein [Peptacetobacter hiranonis]|uniref:hypothetical protein n=1 Tax=Peptacetobacter hiranonis TaxID=89152 RepID=UPI002E77A318|nr:hypothetical protein [Peptacetobacter hiranonis]MEE0249214.1 hypothetical protein [Peptacetobacter hiranonis]
MPGYKEKQPFYKTNSEILKLDPITDKDLIIFNHYISRKENFQRLSEELPKGLFRISYTSIIKDLGFSRWKAQNIMKYFESKNIIECIEKSTKKGIESLYAYTSVYYDETSENDNTNCNTNNNTNDNTNLYSISNGLEGVDNTNCNTNNSTNHNTSKKELLKRDIKKNSTMSDFKKSDVPPGAFKSDNKKTTSSKRKKPKKVFEESSIEYQLSKELYQYVLEEKPKTRKPDFQKWSKDFDLILRKYERSLEDLKNVIDWIFNGNSNNSNFWKRNISSPGALRGTTKNGADKFAEIYSQMENDNSYTLKQANKSYLEDTDVDLSIEDIIKINLGETNNQ